MTSLAHLFFFFVFLVRLNNVYAIPLPESNITDANILTRGNLNSSLLSTSIPSNPITSLSQSLLEAISTDPLLRVETSSGSFVGAYNQSSNVYRYLGIPYAADTSGSNRFAPPQPFQPSSTSNSNNDVSIRDATSYGRTCPQFLSSASQTDSVFAGIVVPDDQGEDCLSLNVWVGKNVRMNAGSGEGAPVMLYFYGGSFTWGSTNNPLTDGNAIVRNHDDVIIVSVNYRLNIFGFPNSPQIQDAPEGINLGLLDRDAAVGWIKRNIASFGGDGNRIILWGQSAGGSSVDAWAFSHSGQDGLPSSKDSGVVGILLESGAVQGLSSFVSGSNTLAPTSPLASWNSVAKSVGCGTEGDQVQLDCMRSKSFHNLIAAIGSNNFAPTPDQKTWFSDFESRAQKGKFAKVPYLLGNNANEGTILSTVANSTLTSGVGALVITPLVFQCPATDASSLRVEAGVPTYRYIYYGSWADIHSGRPELAAYHGSEIPLVWGSFGPTPVASATGGNVGPATVEVPPEEIATSKYIMQSWTTFAKDPVRGLASSGWPRYDSDPLSKTVAGIAISNSGTVQWQTPQGVLSGCGLGNGVQNLLQQLFHTLGGWI